MVTSQRPSRRYDSSASSSERNVSAYRWQYIVSGVRNRHFSQLLASMTTPEQMSRISAALAPIISS